MPIIRRYQEVMKILIDITHPAHLHFFRNVAARLESEGHSVKWTGRDKDILVQLVQSYKLEVEMFGEARKGAINMGRELIYRQWRLLKIIREFKPDAILAIAGTYVSLPGKIGGIPTYIFYDTEHATISNMLSYPFSTCTYVPRCYRKSIRWRHERYNGYHEMAYLHPKYFKPDPSILSEVNIMPNEIFSIIRFVGWGASHDMGLTGLTDDNKRIAVEKLNRYGKVFISSEAPLHPDLEPYRLRLDLAKIHNLMAFAAVIFGESATMCSEGAILGVPGVYIDPVGRGYTDEQENTYGLVFNFHPERQEKAIAKAEEILANYDRKDWHKRRAKLLMDKIDVNELIYHVTTEHYRNNRRKQDYC